MLPSDVDIRERSATARRIVGGYATERILASYENIDGLLARCPDHGTQRAYDAGSGLLLESLGLARRFRTVVATDVDPRTVLRARVLTRWLGVQRVTVRRADAESYQDRSPFDLVLSNAMSHSGRSRLALLQRLASNAGPGAWMVYSEECEAYVPQAIHEAVAARDIRAVQVRVAQALRGITGSAGFRFFFSGTAAPAVRALGLDVVSREHETWHGGVMLERLFCRVQERTSPSLPRFTAGDYLTGTEQHRELRAIVTQAVADLGSGRGGLSNSNRTALERVTENQRGTTSAGLAVAVQMAEWLPALRNGRAAKAVDRLRLPLASAKTDWTTLDQLDELMVSALAPGDLP